MDVEERLVSDRLRGDPLAGDAPETGRNVYMSTGGGDVADNVVEFFGRESACHDHGPRRLAGANERRRLLHATPPQTPEVRIEGSVGVTAHADELESRFGMISQQLCDATCIAVRTDQAHGSCVLAPRSPCA